MVAVGSRGIAVFFLEVVVGDWHDLVSAHCPNDVLWWYNASRISLKSAANLLLGDCNV